MRHGYFVLRHPNLGRRALPCSRQNSEKGGLAGISLVRRWAGLPIRARGRSLSLGRDSPPGSSRRIRTPLESSCLSSCVHGPFHGPNILIILFSKGRRVGQLSVSGLQEPRNPTWKRLPLGEGRAQAASSGPLWEFRLFFAGRRCRNVVPAAHRWATFRSAHLRH